jgi:hypothetical protein
MDPGATSLAVANRVPVVGGPGGDGWFKMFEFFEVPSQMTGAIGPVVQGANFDWARQDSKPGLMNINLIADEEAFFSIFGARPRAITRPCSTPSSCRCSPTNGQFMLPYAMPWRDEEQCPPIPGAAPVPLVVSASSQRGPSYAYPLTDQTQSISTVPPSTIGLAMNRGNGGAPRAVPGWQPDQGGLRAVPLVAPWRVGLPIRPRQRNQR